MQVWSQPTVVSWNSFHISKQLPTTHSFMFCTFTLRNYSIVSSLHNSPHSFPQKKGNPKIVWPICLFIFIVFVNFMKHVFHEHNFLFSIKMWRFYALLTPILNFSLYSDNRYTLFTGGGYHGHDKQTSNKAWSFWYLHIILMISRNKV